MASCPQRLRIDIGTLDLASSCPDAAVALCFDPAAPGHLLVSMSSRVVVLDPLSGRTVREVSPGTTARSLAPTALRRGGEAQAACCPTRRAEAKDAPLQLPSVRPETCSALALSEDARFLLTATGRAVKVWSYSTQADLGCQVCARAGETSGPQGPQ